MELKFSLEFELDKNGFFDYECFEKECEKTFKINKFIEVGKIIKCPYCGIENDRDKMYTPQQIEAIEKAKKKAVTDYGIDFVNQQLKKSFGRMKSSKNIKISYHTSNKKYFKNNYKLSNINLEEWEFETNCKKCECKYVVIGCGYFCPCCGGNNLIEAFNQSMNSIKNILENLDEIENSFENLDHKSRKNVMNSLLETQFKEIIGSFQKYLYDKFIEKSSLKVRVNDFQIISKGNELFYENFGYKYIEILDNEEQENMEICFQKRHCFEHNNGIVDEKMILKTKDLFKLGNRIYISKDEILSFREIIIKIYNFIEEKQ